MELSLLGRQYEAMVHAHPMCSSWAENKKSDPKYSKPGGNMVLMNPGHTGLSLFTFPHHANAVLLFASPRQTRPSKAIQAQSSSTLEGPGIQA